MAQSSAGGAKKWIHIAPGPRSAEGDVESSYDVREGSVSYTQSFRRTDRRE
jgi:hypothetical protein